MYAFACPHCVSWTGIASLGTRARCPSLYKHATNVISSMGTGSRGDGDGDGDGGTDGGDGKPPAWRVYAPAGVPIVSGRITDLTVDLGLKIVLLLCDSSK